MLLKSERNSTHGGATILNHDDLNGTSSENNCEEEEVIEEAMEDVVLMFTKLTRVDFIEDLHENEGMEDQSEMLELVEVGLVNVEVLFTSFSVSRLLVESINFFIR